MPTDDELVRRLTMGGLDPHMAALVAGKHGEQRISKTIVRATSPGVGNPGFELTKLQPGEQLLGLELAVTTAFGSTFLASVSAANAPTLPLTVVADTSDQFLIGDSLDMKIAAGVYSTVDALVTALNASLYFGQALSTMGIRFSNVGGKLKLAADNVAGDVKISTDLTHPVSIAALGFASGQLSNGVVPTLYLETGLTNTPGDSSQLFSVSCYASDDPDATGLFTPAGAGGMLVARGAPFGYVPLGADPLPLRLALTDGLVPGYSTIHSDGTGEALIWLWISSLF